MKRGAILLGLGGVVLGAGIAVAALSRSSAAPAQITPQPAAVRSATIPTPAIVATPTVDHATRSARSAPSPQAPRTTPLPGLVADLADADPKIRRAAMREAARDVDLDPALLIAAVHDRDLEVGVTATIALGKRYASGDVEASELVTVVGDRGLDDRVRVSALNALGLVASSEATSLLLDLLAHGSVTERASAAILLVHQDAELAMPALIGALGDSEQLVRSNALDSLRARARGRDFGTNAAAWQAWWQSRPR